jgi:hypothetical protein
MAIDTSGNGVFSEGRAKLSARTFRTDKWWVQPTITVVVLFSFIVYATFRAFENGKYFAEAADLSFLFSLSLYSLRKRISFIRGNNLWDVSHLSV